MGRTRTSSLVKAKASFIQLLTAQTRSRNRSCTALARDTLGRRIYFVTTTCFTKLVSVIFKSFVNLISRLANARQYPRPSKMHSGAQLEVMNRNSVLVVIRRARLTEWS